MKTLLSIYLILFTSVNIYAQLFGPMQLINDDTGNLSGLLSGDLDNDGDLDLLTVSTNEVSWHENLDGLGNFDTTNVIDQNQSLALGQAINDLDGDERLDIIISSFEFDRVVWFRSQGNGHFGSAQIIATNLNSAKGITPADLDGDGDMDLILGVTNGSGFYWVENLDGNGSFSTLIPINNTLSQARLQVAGDIDGDGDLDILSNSVDGVIMSWFENIDGQGNFSTQHIIETTGLYENHFNLADIDGDDDLDILSNKIDEILWRENLDGQGNFGAKITINLTTNSTPDFVNANAVDLDNDGDLDVAYNSVEDFGSIWQENLNGLGNFGPVQFIDPDFIGPVQNLQPADIDNDGDIDLVMNSLIANGDKLLFWYENLTILGVPDFAIKGLKIYPNPAKDILFLKSPEPIEHVTIYDLLGKRLLQENKEQINISSLPAGLLFVEVKTTSGVGVKKLLKK